MLPVVNVHLAHTVVSSPVILGLLHAKTMSASRITNLDMKRNLVEHVAVDKWQEHIANQTNCRCYY